MKFGKKEVEQLVDFEKEKGHLKLDVTEMKIDVVVKSGRQE